MFFGNTSIINPGLYVSKNKLSFTAVKPTFGDYLIVIAINLIAIPLSWYTTKDYFYASVSLLFYWILSYSLIDDEFYTEINLDLNEISIKKSKTGRIKWIRVSQADELINAEVVEIKSSKKQSATSSYRLDLEFMSEMGYYRLQTSETSVLGEQNKMELEKLAIAIQKFMKLKPLPASLKEDALRKTMPTSMRKQDRDALRKEQ